MRANERASERGRKGNRGREGWIGGERKREDGVGRKEREREEERLRAMERRRLSAWRWTGAEPQKVAQPAPLLLFLCPSRFHPYICPRLLSDQEESSSLGPGCEASFIRHLSASQPGLGLTLHAVAQCRSPASRVQFARLDDASRPQWPRIRAAVRMRPRQQQERGQASVLHSYPAFCFPQRSSP